MRASARYKVKWPQCLKTRSDYSIGRLIRIIIQVLYVHGLVVYRNQVNIDHLNLKIYCGSQWFIAPYETIKYFTKYLNFHPEYIEYWRNALAPDEFFFQTLVMNSEWSKLVEPQLMFHRAGRTFGTKNHPVIISEEHKDEIDKGNYFSARKFSMTDESNTFYYYLNSANDAYNYTMEDY